MITARAHTNIALIKYWGKRNKKLFLPYNSSLSLTLDCFYTDTSVRFIEAPKDIFYLNGVEQAEAEVAKISRFIDLFRQEAQSTKRVAVFSQNHVPTAAGLASSASAYAALALALNEQFHLNKDPKTLSTLARQGSGSASRSLFGGLVEWQKGVCKDGQDSFAQALLAPEACPLAMIICLVNGEKKAVSSREGMERTVQTSPFYPAWVEASAADLQQMKVAIQQQNWRKVGQLSEGSALKMHATTLGAYPPFTYLEPHSWMLIRKIQKWREEGIFCYATMDAGPNVKILCLQESITEIEKRLQQACPELSYFIARPGQAAKLINEEVAYDSSKCTW